MENALIMARMGLTTAALLCAREGNKREGKKAGSGKRFLAAASAIRAAVTAIDAILSNELA